MKRVAIFLIALALAAPTFGATPQRPLIVTTQDHSLVTVDDCGNFYARTSTSFRAEANAEEQMVVPLTGVSKLRVTGSVGGGVSIRGWDRPMARLTVCKYAVADSWDMARKSLGSVVVTAHSGSILATGPDSDSSGAWWVHMILRVPKRTAVEVESMSGGIAIRDMTGSVVAKATNGGISLAGFTGDSRLTTENGGISLERIGGRIQASTQNGSISLKLDSTETAAVEARTDPVNEIVCRAKVCADATSSRGAGGSRILRIGSAQPMIRLSAGSAPIIIEQVR